jgi:hypothetical protein
MDSKRLLAVAFTGVFALASVMPAHALPGC